MKVCAILSRVLLLGLVGLFLFVSAGAQKALSPRPTKNGLDVDTCYACHE
jgi:hypothetical protein